MSYVIQYQGHNRYLLDTKLYWHPVHAYKAHTIKTQPLAFDTYQDAREALDRYNKDLTFGSLTPMVSVVQEDVNLIGYEELL